MFGETFNRCEAGLWLVIALTVFFYAGKRSEHRKRLLVLGGAFVVFGWSDWIEASTGAWWRPWWLLLVKVCCIGIFARTFWLWNREKKR